MASYNVLLTDIGTDTELGSNGVVFTVKNEKEEIVGKIVVNTVGVEWIPKSGHLGHGYRLNIDNFGKLMMANVKKR